MSIQSNRASSFIWNWPLIASIPVVASFNQSHHVFCFLFSKRHTILNELSRFLWNRCRQFRLLMVFVWKLVFFGKCILFDSYWFLLIYILIQSMFFEKELVQLEKDCTSMLTPSLTPCWLLAYLFWDIDESTSVFFFKDFRSFFGQQSTFTSFFPQASFNIINELRSLFRRSRCTWSRNRACRGSL